MEEHEKPQCHFFMGFLIGSVLGALAGILFAPKSGKELRSDIKEKGSEVLKDAKEIYSDASTRAKEIIEEATHQAKELKKEADRHLSEARQKAKEILARDKKEAEAVKDTTVRMASRTTGLRRRGNDEEAEKRTDKEMDGVGGVFVSCSGGDGSAVLGCRRTSHGGRPHISYRRGSAPLCS